MEVKKINENEYALRLLKGEKVMTSLEQIAKENKIYFASVQGVGALTDVQMGVYNLTNKNYDKQNFQGDYELISALGNLARLESNDPFAHIHVGLGKEDYSMIGGHLFEATVAVTAEFFIKSYAMNVKRIFNDELKIKLWDLERCHPNS